MVKRVVKRVRGGPAQQQMFGPSEEPEVLAEGGPRSLFVDPPPAELTVGPLSLRAYLEASGNQGVFDVRRLIRGLDYEPFLARYSCDGRTPYHPALMVGLVVYAAMLGARSLRQIEALAKESVCAWWLTGGACPDHASIGRFVARFGDLFEGHVFEALTAKVLEETGSSGTDLAGDGTTIASAACRFGLIGEEVAKEKAAVLRARAKQLDPERCPEECKKLEQKAESYDRAVSGAQRVAKNAKRDAVRRSKAKVALSDPDATHQKLKNGLPAPSYKPTILANEARIVVAHTVESSSENAAVGGLCEQAKRVSQVKQLDCVRLDAGFFSGDVVQTLLGQEVDNPLITDRPVMEKKRTRKRKRKTPRLFAKSEFEYDEAGDAYTCPAGKLLKLVKTRKSRGEKIYGRAPCSACPLRDKCTTSKYGRRVRRYTNDHLREAMLEVMANPLARAEYAKRSYMVEPVFADLRQRHGFWRFLRVGLARVRVEFALVAIAHNLMRHLTITRAKAIEAALAALRSMRAGWALWAESCPGAPRDLTSGCLDSQAGPPWTLTPQAA